MHHTLSWFRRLRSSTNGSGLILLTSLAIAGLLMGLRSLGALEGMELAAYDRLLRLRPNETQDDRLLIVGVTDEDILQFQEWPLSDRTLSSVLEKVLAADPRVVGVDILRDVPIGEGHDELLKQLQDDRIVGACKASSADGSGAAPPTGMHPDLIGFADLPVDPGGTLRRVLLWMEPPTVAAMPASLSHLCNQPQTIFSLSFQIARYYLEADRLYADLTPENQLAFGEVVLPPIVRHTGGYATADDRGYQLLLNYRSLDSVARQISIADVLEGRFDPAWIRDRIVLIGYTTPQSKDEFYTPYSAGLRDDQKMAGVVVQAQAVSQILSAVLDDRPLMRSWSEAAEMGWIVIWSLMGATIGWWFRHPLRFGAVILLAAGILVGICAGLLLQSIWIPLAPAAIGLIVSACGVVLIDRFNRSDYGKAVYRQVKTLLKIEIEIDQTKVEREVAEITQSEYFSELQQKAKEMRGQRRSQSKPRDADPVVPSAPPEPEDDYLQQLQRKAKQTRSARRSSQPDLSANQSDQSDSADRLPTDQSNDSDT